MAWDWPLAVDELFKVGPPTGVLAFEAPVPDEADVFAGSADRGSCLSFRVILSWKTSRSLSIYTSKTCVASGSQVRTESVNKERGKRQKIRQTLLLQLSIFRRKAHRSSRYRAEEKVFKQFHKLADSDRETKARLCSHQYLLKTCKRSHILPFMKTFYETWIHLFYGKQHQWNTIEIAPLPKRLPPNVYPTVVYKSEIFLACRLKRQAQDVLRQLSFFLEVTFYFFDTTLTNHIFSNSVGKI